MSDMSDFNRGVIEEFRANHGAVGGGFAGAPMVLLTTTGAKSGQKRVNPLVGLVDDGTLYVVASKAGAPTSPDWYHNLLANPDVEVEFGDERFEATAVPITSGPERDRLYAAQVAAMPGFADYEKSTTRVIPIVALELPVTGPGRWVGTAATGLGLTGSVQPDDFRCLLQGRHPRTGVGLGSGRVSVAAYDLTFSAPKSASVLFALGGADVADAVVAAHLQAVAGSLTYLEQHGVTALRRVGTDRAVLATTGAAAAAFTHGVSRNGDPHLHSHVVVANLVHGTDGRWSACDRRGLDAHRMAASGVYEAHLRAGVTATLGVRWRAGDPSGAPEIEGVGPELLGAFSSRGADIRRHMYEVGARSGRGARVAWAITRPAKPPSAPFADLAEHWSRQARDAGGAPKLELPRHQLGAERAEFDEHRFAGVISLTAHGGARRRDVVTAFGAAAHNGVTSAALERLVGQWVGPGPVGVAEPLQPRRSIVPANRHLRALGPRPVDPDDHAVWRGAAHALDAYRERWGVPHAAEPPDVPRAAPALASLPATHLADHLRTEREVAAARARLGWRIPMTAERGLAR
jgi:deazaflavin-dependent oxidoreductase (nitroreductase family)